MLQNNHSDDTTEINSNNTTPNSPYVSFSSKVIKYIQENKEAFSLIGVIIGLLSTGLSNMLLYQYSKGVADYFRLDICYINIDVQSILITIIAFLGSCILFAIPAIIYTDWTIRKHHIASTITVIIAYLVSLGVCAFITKLQVLFGTWIIVLMLLYIYVVILFIFNENRIKRSNKANQKRIERTNKANQKRIERTNKANQKRIERTNKLRNFPKIVKWFFNIPDQLKKFFAPKEQREDILIHSRKILKLVFCISLSFVFMLPLAYLFGKNSQKQQKTYKIIEYVDESNVSTKKVLLSETSEVYCLANCEVIINDSSGGEKTTFSLKIYNNIITIIEKPNNIVMETIVFTNADLA